MCDRSIVWCLDFFRVCMINRSFVGCIFVWDNRCSGSVDLFMFIRKVGVLFLIRDLLFY